MREIESRKVGEREKKKQRKKLKVPESGKKV
jgi:hypothetical protein